MALGLEITELRLGLPGDSPCVEKIGKKRAFSEIAAAVVEDEHSASDEGNDQVKNRVVGWPPICSYRQKNSLHERKSGPEAAKIYVKVSMDGAPFLRKIDLNVYKRYSDLSVAFEKLFGCFGIGTLAGNHTEYSEYVPIYEDKDGDWMLVGDVPWEMFIESCKRLRIMKRSEANGIGLQSRSPPTCFHGPSLGRETQVGHEA
ncbi:auxin-induced protein AUX22-like [Magnolia sinica]|uniref:auxin-induced protein AUX22-like n=1 Tax=Magnolia sinica TaxID=86752 RepID=UPI0026595B66|nr:auxin-induced protein AUX22-like [Magnolia sinica]